MEITTPSGRLRVAVSLVNLLNDLKPDPGPFIFVVGVEPSMRLTIDTTRGSRKAVGSSISKNGIAGIMEYRSIHAPTTKAITITTRTSILCRH